MKIHISQPCNEDWNAMTPKEKGRFCDSCAKVVVDFSQMTDNEIVAYFQVNNAKKTCGHFKKEQLLQKEKIVIDLATMPKNMSFRNIFIACCMAVFSSLFFISCNTNSNHTNATGGEPIVVDSTLINDNDGGIAAGEPVVIEEMQGEICIVDSTKK